MRIVTVEGRAAVRAVYARIDVAVLGLWHLGCVSACGFAATGRRVVAWDPDPGLRAGIASAHGPVAEPGVDEALAAALADDALVVADDPEAAIASAPVTYLAYDTALGESGLPDDPRLDDAVATFAAAAPDAALLLVSSQIPVGTCARWKPVLDGANRGLLLAHAPENLRLGSALEDFLHPPRLLIGADDDAAFDRAAGLLMTFSAEPRRLLLASAEMAKHATNAYLALCIAFANDLAWISEFAGADAVEVADALRADPRVAPTAPLRPGTAFSGATLIRDLATLRALGEACDRPDLFAAVIAANDRHAQLAVTWLIESLGSLDGRRIGVAGLTYKPGTSTLRDSLPFRVVRELVAAGATVVAWDPAAEPLDEKGVTRVGSLDECARDADAVAILTALPELRAVDWGALQPRERLLVDVCSVADRAAAESAGWRYRGFPR
jgi:UDPglucose 6-dehydrogenase